MNDYIPLVVQDDDTRKFLELFGGADAPQTFQMFPEPKERSGCYPCIKHGSFNELAAELKQQNEQGCGVYMVVNQTDLMGRTSDNIRAVRALYLDLDGAPLEPVLNAGLTPHAVIETSPGKYHVYFLVADCPLQQFSTYQKSLIAEFNGDKSVHDLSRVLRLPGFYHMKGEPVLSRALQVNHMPAYSVQQILDGLGLQVGHTQLARTSSKASTKVKQSYGDGDRTNAMTTYVGRLYNAGHDVEEAIDLCKLWNQKHCCPPLPDQKVASTTKSIYRTAWRRQKSSDPLIDEINQEFLFTLMGGKAVVIHETPEGLIVLPLNDFKALLENKRTRDGQRAATYWLGHPERRQFKRVVFNPEENHGPDDYNLWKGFAVEPDPDGDCTLFLSHLRNVICAGDEGCYEYVLNWLADAVQNPGRLPEVAIVLAGGQGIGKGKFVDYFGAIFGDHYYPMHTPDALVGAHTPHLAHAALVFADEALFTGDPKIIGALKTVITEKKRMVNPKGKDMYTVDNYVRVIMASNNIHILPVESDDRRSLILQVSEHKKVNHDYFGTIEKEKMNGGPSALLDVLLKRDLSGFQVRNIPVTGAKIEQKLFSLDEEVLWYFSCLQAGEIVAESMWPSHVSKADFFKYYLDSPTATPWKRNRNNKHFYRVMKPVLEGFYSRPSKSPRGINFPSLQDCRKSFEQYIGGPIEWDD